MKRKSFVLVLLLIFLLPSLAFTHGGRTNSAGCLQIEKLVTTIVTDQVKAHTTVLILIAMFIRTNADAAMLKAPVIH